MASNGYFLEPKVNTCCMNKFSKKTKVSSLQKAKRLYINIVVEESNSCLDRLQEQLASLRVNEGRIKKRKSFRMPIMLEAELKNKIALSENNIVLKEFFVKSSYS